MRNRKDVSDLILVFVKKWLFPDFSNKLTWLIATVGVGIIVTPDPIVLMVYNWLVGAFNINSGVPFTLPEIGSRSTHSLYGVALIALALTHNLLNQYLVSQNLGSHVAISEQRERSDMELYNKFITEFGSHSASVVTMKDQHFGSAFRIDHFEELANFRKYWNIPERTFLNKNIEAAKQELWNKCLEFHEYLSLNSYSQHNIEIYSVIPDQYKGKSQLPEFVSERISKLNDMAEECYRLHGDFVLLCKEELNC